MLPSAIYEFSKLDLAHLTVHMSLLS